MDHLNVGVIGVGHLGSLHAKMYAQISSVNLVGVYDIDSQRAEKLATEFGIKAFSTLDDLLSQVEAVSIATVDTIALRCGNASDQARRASPNRETDHHNHRTSKSTDRTGRDKRIEITGRAY